MFDFSEIKGQEHAKRAVEIAAAGNHNIILTGNAGNGKTTLAMSGAGLVAPDLNQITAITPISEIDDYEHAVRNIKDKRVILIDDLHLIPDKILDFLSCYLPLYAGWVIATAASCDCGNAGSYSRQCTCTEPERRHFNNRLRRVNRWFSMEVVLPEIVFYKLVDAKQGETTEIISKRVDTVLLRRKFNQNLAALVANLHADAEKLLKQATNQMALSARSFNNTLAIAKTISYLSNSDTITAPFLAEAIQYRNKEI
jgi:magnesium chelatase family protein